MTAPLTLARLEELEQLSANATRDWPAVSKALDGMVVMEWTHGREYSGPSIDFDALIAALPDLLPVVRGLLALGPEIDARLAEHKAALLPSPMMAKALADLLRQVRSLIEGGA